MGYIYYKHNFMSIYYIYIIYYNKIYKSIRTLTYYFLTYIVRIFMNIVLKYAAVFSQKNKIAENNIIYSFFMR